MIKVLSPKNSYEIIENNYIGNLAYIHKDTPYIVPITYFFDKESNTIISYSGEGHKVNAMRKNCNVSLSVSEIDTVSNWKSVLVVGTFEVLSGSNAKSFLHKFTSGVRDIILRKEEKNLHFIGEFSSTIYKDEIPIVFIIKIEEVTGRERKK